jgi:hypothetical protein
MKNIFSIQFCILILISSIIPARELKLRPKLAKYSVFHNSAGSLLYILSLDILAKNYINCAKTEIIKAEKLPAEKYFLFLLNVKPIE